PNPSKSAGPAASRKPSKTCAQIKSSKWTSLLPERLQNKPLSRTADLCCLLCLPSSCSASWRPPTSPSASNPRQLRPTSHNVFRASRKSKRKLPPSNVRYERDEKGVLVTAAIFYFPKKTPSGDPPSRATKGTSTSTARLKVSRCASISSRKRWWRLVARTFNPRLHLLRNERVWCISPVEAMT